MWPVEVFREVELSQDERFLFRVGLARGLSDQEVTETDLAELF